MSEQDKINLQLTQRIKALEEWRDHILQSLMYAPTPEAKPAPKQQPVTPANQILDAFPEELREFLTVSGDTIKTKYVSRDKWVVMDEIARKLGYRYEAGKGWQK